MQSGRDMSVRKSVHTTWGEFPAEIEIFFGLDVEHPLSQYQRVKKNMDELIAELKVKLIDILNLPDVTPQDFDEKAQLVGGELGIDSIDVLEMVVMVEKDYGIIINSQEVGEKVFASLAALADYIRTNQADSSS